MNVNRGLSPRVRGKRPPIQRHREEAVVYPRVCGGSTGHTERTTKAHGLSPRVRGKHLPQARNDALRRSIPACAGEAAANATPMTPPSVYPRVCGGSVIDQPAILADRGLSPRVRGKPLRFQAPIAG